jgi:hypothetical protein
VWRPSPKQIGWPSLRGMVVPANEDAKENPRRLIVMSEKHPGVYPWLLGAYDVSQETPFTFTSIPQFTCKANRGGNDKSFFIVNHWLRPNGPPDPVAAGKVNSQKTLTARLQDCIATRGQLPNAVAVDFTAVGDLYKTVNRFNAAIARQSGVTGIVLKAVDQLRSQQDLTDAQLAELNALHRLPKISEASARKLLGPLADAIPAPRALPKLANPCPPGTRPRSNAELAAAKRAEKRAKKRAGKSSTTTTTSPEPSTTTPAVPEGCVPD